MLRFTVPLLAVLALGCASTPGAPSVRELRSAKATASRQPIRLPEGDVRVVLSEYVIPAGAKLPVHKHPYFRLALVQEGRLAVTNVDTGETVTYGPGDMVVESIDQWHFGETLGTTTVRLLVLDQMPAGAAGNVVPR